jgi:hypothetical protein
MYIIKLALFVIRAKVILQLIGRYKMTKPQIIEQMEIWIRQGRLTFDDLQLLSSQAYAKEAAQDEQ